MGQSGEHINHPLQHEGQVQSRRLQPALTPESTPLDDRDRAGLLAYLKGIAGAVPFFDHEKPLQKDAEGRYISPHTWERMMEYLTDAELQRHEANGDTPPHLALADILCRLYAIPQAVLNKNTERHLDFYYRDMLGMTPLPVLPHRVHLLPALKKNTAPVMLPKGTECLGPAGTDKQPLRYATLHDALISHAAVTDIQALQVAEDQPDVIRFATAANSADGVGAALDKNDPSWPGFGANYWPQGQVGFALAAPVLRMQQGIRTLTLFMEVEGLPPGISPAQLEQTFALSLTGEKGWIHMGEISPQLTQGTATTTGINRFRLSCTLSDTEPPVCDYDVEVHGGAFSHPLPIMQLMVHAEKSPIGYDTWKQAILISATLQVQVSDIRSFKVETDAGAADPAKPFYMFGPTAPRNAGCFINYPEAFEKPLEQVTLNVTWKNVPAANLANYYDYNQYSNTAFRMMATYKDGSGKEYSDTHNLFNTNNATSDRSWHLGKNLMAVVAKLLPKWFVPAAPKLKLSPGQTVAHKMFSLQQIGPSPMVASKKNMNIQVKMVAQMLALSLIKPVMRQGLMLTLTKGFGFEIYRRELAKRMAVFARNGGTLALPKEPFAPEVKEMTFGYTASSGKISFGNEAGIFPNPGRALHLYHIWPFGMRYEDALLRQHLPHASTTVQTMLPVWNHQGACFVGVSNTGPQQELTLLVRVVEGSAHPDKRGAEVQWDVLANNYWRRLGDRELLMDTTEGLQTTGVVRIILPQDSTTEHTWMSEDKVWLRISIPHDVDAVCRLISVTANAVIAEALHPEKAMGTIAAGSISKLAVTHPAVATLSQPMDTFGGRPAEDRNAWYVRVSERLRHKQRAVTVWDMAHLVLQAFPEVFQAKAIPHSQAHSTVRPGHVLMVVVPQPANGQFLQPLQPKTSIYTREKVMDYLQQHSTAWARYEVINPLYYSVHIEASIRLRTGHAFGFYRQEVERALQEFLAPWLGGGTARFRFGGRLSQAQVVHCIDSLSFVEFVTEVKLFLQNERGDLQQMKEIQITHPAGVLTSAPTHTLRELS